MMESEILSTDVLGVPITCFCSYDHAAEAIVARIRNGSKTLCIAINPEKICFARNDDAFGDIVRHGHIHICDGIGAALAVRWIVGWRIPRITGVGLFFKLLETAERQRLSVFLLGGKPEISDKTYETLRTRHPEMVIAGRQHGFFTDTDDVLRRINASGAAMLFAALGSPRQERWLSAHLDRIAVPFCMGVGGSFDVLTGSVKRAPEVFQRTGTEFLYRLLCQPWRWRRQSVLLGFGAKVLVKAVAARGPQALFRSRAIRKVYTQAERGAPESASTL
jgi:N-acetylglucosaminyldiphosphoundecaprenol N-acetyl-beta-D-mannosaminyltransferase